MRPTVVAETIRLAAGVGLVGGSIEDATGNKDAPLFDFGQAVERVARRGPGGARAAVPVHADRAQPRTSCAAIPTSTT